MKFKTCLLIIASAITANIVFSADEVPLEYVTSDALQTALRNDGGKTDVFYWGNFPRDRMMVPVTKADPGGVILEIRGADVGVADRSSLASFLTRLIPVPPEKSKVTVTVETNYSFDLWCAARHSTNRSNDFPSVVAFFGDGKKVCADIPLPTANVLSSWNENAATFDIPPGAKFLGLTLMAPGGSIAKLRKINVAFE